MLCNSIGYFNNLTHEMKTQTQQQLFYSATDAFLFICRNLVLTQFMYFYKVNYFVKLINVSINRV